MPSASRPRSPTLRSGSSPWASGASTTARCRRTIEIRVMGRLAAESIEAGALGFSTSRSRNHKASDGRITPSFSAGDAELLGIADAIGHTGKGVFEINVENTDVEGELRLMRRICEISGRPLSAALLQRGGQPSDNYRRVLDGFAAGGPRRTGAVGPGGAPAHRPSDVGARPGQSARRLDRPSKTWRPEPGGSAGRAGGAPSSKRRSSPSCRARQI